MPYRRDIDGLRAFAVLLVTLFHLDVAMLEGGFVGVDVFFVISGYLITRNILKDGAAFKFSTFYVSRIRRLMPALWAATSATMLVAPIFMDSDDLTRAAQSAVATVFSVSNFFFWLQADYWDTSSALKPLLHTWSLAVEEQFYLVWPILIFLLRPFAGRWALTIAMLALALAGLALSEWATSRFPSAAFYLMPFRAAEFAMGALLASGERHVRWRIPAVFRDFMPVLGVGMISWAALSYNDMTRFPGLSAVLPCLGAALIIAGGPKTSSRLVLASTPVVFIGRLSYSLYLAHWPVIVFYKYATFSPLTPVVQASLFAVMLALAIALYFGVEKPFRHGQVLRLGHALALGAVFTLAVPIAPLLVEQRVRAESRSIVADLAPAEISIAAAESASAGVGSELGIEAENGSNLPTHLPNDAKQPPPENARVDWRAALNMTTTEALAQRETYSSLCPGGAACETRAEGKLNIMIVGDSHALDAYNIMRSLYPEERIVLYGGPGCPNYLGLEKFLSELAAKQAVDEQFTAGCRWNWDRIYSDPARLAIFDVVVFSHLSYGEHGPMAVETIRHIRRHARAAVIVLGTAPWFAEGGLLRIAKARKLTPGDTVPAELIVPGGWESDETLKAAVEAEGATFLSKLDFFCPNRACRPYTPDGSALISYDESHLSLGAARAFAAARRAEIADAVQRGLQR